MTAEQLLELQLNDTAIDQIRHRLPRLPEVLASDAANEAVAEWERRSSALHAAGAAFEEAIAAAEKSSGELTTKRDRLEKQLKTVISPREAEALMHEIELLTSQRSALDDDELAALEGLGDIETALAEHRAAEAQIRSTANTAGEAAAAATAEQQTELSDRLATRDELRASLDAGTVARYDSMRASHGGIAVARLNGLQCEGCHLDMSRAEVDEVKRLPPGELAECPNCGRLLVR